MILIYCWNILKDYLIYKRLSISKFQENKLAFNSEKNYLILNQTFIKINYFDSCLKTINYNFLIY